MTRQLCNIAASGSRERPQNNAGLSGSVIAQLRKRARAFITRPSSSMAADSPNLEFKNHVETQGPLTLSRVLIERFTVVQRSVIANFGPDQ
jgi:hypothetical protein